MVVEFACNIDHIVHCNRSCCILLSLRMSLVWGSGTIHTRCRLSSQMWLFQLASSCLQWRRFPRAAAGAAASPASGLGAGTSGTVAGTATTGVTETPGAAGGAPTPPGPDRFLCMFAVSRRVSVPVCELVLLFQPALLPSSGDCRHCSMYCRVSTPGSTAPALLVCSIALRNLTTSLIRKQVVSCQAVVAGKARQLRQTQCCVERSGGP